MGHRGSLENGISISERNWNIGGAKKEMKVRVSRKPQTGDVPAKVTVSKKPQIGAVPAPHVKGKG